MSVRKRQWTTRLGEPKEAWIVDYVDGQGDRHIETFAKKKDADAYHDKVRMDVRQGMHTAPSKAATVAEAAREWIKRVEANGMRGDGPAERSTVRQYRQHVDLHIVPRIGIINVAKLTHARVEAFRDELLASLSRPLARKVLTSLKSILKAAKGRGLATKDVQELLGHSSIVLTMDVYGHMFPRRDDRKELAEATAALLR
jgi:integrase